MSNGSNDISVEVELEIPFQDCDPMGVTWHGNYFRYLETARSALLNKIGYNYSEMKKTGYSWPIVDTRLKFLQPTRFPERIRITATLKEYENRMKIEYVIRNAITGKAATRGYSIQVAVKADTLEMCFCSPEEFVSRVLAFGKKSDETPAS